MKNLRRSVYSADRTRKSCPECSARAGRLVFKPCPEAFGTRDVRPQSWCNECRTQARSAA